MGSDPITAPPETPSGGLDHARSLLRDGKEIFFDHLKLASLEAKRAGLSLLLIVVLGIAISFLLICSWLGLMGALILLLVEKGLLAGSTGMLLAIGINLLMMLILGWVVIRQLNHMKFPATARSLKTLMAENSPEKDSR